MVMWCVVPISVIGTPGRPAEALCGDSHDNPGLITDLGKLKLLFI